jgi:hypothetical protein
MKQESIRLMQSACLVPITSQRLLGTEKRVATDQSMLVHLQTLQLQEKNKVFSVSFSVNKERYYSGNHIYIFTNFFDENEYSNL